MQCEGPDHRIILVSGPPASGKTTVARPLAAALGYALLTKDEVKEALFTAMQGPAGDLEFSRKIGGAAMEVLWALAPQCPRVVVEANFRTRSSYERGKVAALEGRIVEVHCRLPLQEASRRFAQRAREERHHPAHALQEISLEQLAEYAEPFAMNPVIEVDTSTPVDVRELADRIGRILEGSGSSTRRPSAI
jgi:predicted kinase